MGSKQTGAIFVAEEFGLFCVQVHKTCLRGMGQVLVVQEANAAAPESREARNGVTPAMRDARRRHFKPEALLEAELIQRVEEDLLTIVSVRPPPHFKGAPCLVWKRAVCLKNP